MNLERRSTRSGWLDRCERTRPLLCSPPRWISCRRCRWTSFASCACPRSCLPFGMCADVCAGPRTAPDIRDRPSLDPEGKVGARRCGRRGV